MRAAWEHVLTPIEQRLTSLHRAGIVDFGVAGFVHSDADSWRRFWRPVTDLRGAHAVACIAPHGECGCAMCAARLADTKRMGARASSGEGGAFVSSLAGYDDDDDEEEEGEGGAMGRGMEIYDVDDDERLCGATWLEEQRLEKRRHRRAHGPRTLSTARRGCGVHSSGAARGSDEGHGRVPPSFCLCDSASRSPSPVVEMAPSPAMLQLERRRSELISTLTAVARGRSDLIYCPAPPVALECDPKAAGGCTVCAACCHAYIVDGAPCAACAAEQCAAPSSPQQARPPAPRFDCHLIFSG